jgi:ABC-2 type transport system permease protein
MKRLSLARIIAVTVKEFTQLRRDRITYAMILVMPLMQLLLFGYAINTDPRHLPAAVVSHDHGRLANAVVATLERTSYVDVTHLPTSEEEMDRLMRRGDMRWPDHPARFQRACAEGRQGAGSGRGGCHRSHGGGGVAAAVAALPACAGMICMAARRACGQAPSRW